MATLSRPGVANASTIGVFSWNEFSLGDCDLLSLCGAFFSVENISDDPVVSLGLPGQPFVDVFVDLQTDAGLQTLALGDVAPGDSSASIEDLSGFSISSASLRFSFGLPGDLTVPDLLAPGSVVIEHISAVPVPPLLPAEIIACLGIVTWRLRRADA